MQGAPSHTALEHGAGERSQHEPSPVSWPAIPIGPLPRGWTSLGRAFIQCARANGKREAMTDTRDSSLSYNETLVRSLALGRVLAREVGPSPYVGVLLPPSVPAAVANLALTLRGKIPVNLNYTTGQEVLDASVQQCGITHVVTSRLALGKLGLEPKASLVYLEDVPKKVTPNDKAFAWSVANVVPAPLLGLFLPGLRGSHLDQTATVIFTSGSTGEPKGVMLSHGNVLWNIHQINSHLSLGRDETILGILPFFHSFGFTVTIWTVLCLGKKVVYHFNPLDARIVGNLCEKHGATLMTASPTFMRGYAKKCDREQFKSMRLPVLGAEKLKPELGDEIREKLGIEPLEGYGCTETGPGVAADVPEEKKTPDGRTVWGNRPGTVGIVFPGTLIKTVDPETGADLPRGAEGLVYVKGPQVMKGYLNKPEITARVLRDGWYNTGDLGHQDADGFLTITGRLSRFSKIAGEMVPHERVESAILGVAASEHPQVAVTSVSDAKRGERLVVLYDDLGMTPEEAFRRLATGSMPRLWLPSIDDFLKVDHIPTLATGKVDLREVRRLAAEHAEAR
jgi:acyl-[acyl-carrier-protein]-phospholipid O-acyltransferase/long-chain-fatty-acid--[acyl-carrier-protein] ligase